ncbi:MAG: transposase [Candidatus Omnitrophota bacterium]
MPRIARIIIENYPHHVTQRGINRSEIFLDNSDRRLFLANMKELSTRFNVKIWAYCLMQNHFHLLLIPLDSKGMSKFIHGLTFKHAQHFNKKYGRTGHLWENRFFSCPVDKDSYFWAAVRYIENNPVRAKLVSTAEEWVWSSAGAHIKKGKDLFLDNSSDWLTEYERDEYVKFCREDTFCDNNNIRKTTSSGRPFGTENFIEEIGQKTNRNLKSGKAGRPKKEKYGGCP